MKIIFKYIFFLKCFQRYTIYITSKHFTKKMKFGLELRFKAKAKANETGAKQGTQEGLYVVSEQPEGLEQTSGPSQIEILRSLPMIGCP